MTPIDDFSRHYAEHIEGVYECVDRIVINAYFQLGINGGGFRYWWRQLHGGSDATLTNERLKKDAGEFARRVRGWARAHQIPVIDAHKSERKDEIAADYVKKAEDRTGIFLIIVGAAPAPVFNIVRHAEKGHIIDIRHHKPWRHANYFHFHIMDRQWGHVVVRMCGYAPYGAQVIVNGHEWVDRKAREQGLSPERYVNSFVDAQDYTVLNRLNASLESRVNLEALCDRWIYSACLCFGLTRHEQRETGFRYTYSLYQLELSRNYLFHRGATLDETYQGILDRTRSRLDVALLKTIFGSRQRPRIKLAKRDRQRGCRAAEVSREVNRLEHDLTVFKVHWDKRTLKLYDKGARLLRAELVIHNAKALKRRRQLPDLGEISEIMRQTLTRFMGAVQAAHVATVDRQAFESLSEPGRLGSQRLAGIHLTHARMRSVMDTVVALSTAPAGFSLEQVAEGVRQRQSWNRGKYDRGQASYDLRKLRAKHLVRKRRKSRNYEVDPDGLGLLCGLATLHDHVLVPILTIMSRGLKSAKTPSDPQLVDRHYEQIRQASVEILRHHGAAA